MTIPPKLVRFFVIYSIMATVIMILLCYWVYDGCNHSKCENEKFKLCKVIVDQTRTIDKLQDEKNQEHWRLNVNSKKNNIKPLFDY